MTAKTATTQHDALNWADYDTLYSIMAKRMSARQLKPDPIPDHVVHKVLDAAHWAMSGANAQPWEFIVVKDPVRKQQLADAYRDTNMEFCFWMEQMRSYELRHPNFQVEGDSPEAVWEKMKTGSAVGWAKAPVVIVVLGDGRRQWATVAGAHTFGRHASHLTDGLANCCTHLHLAIASLGLGSQWVTIHIQEPFKRILKVPDLLEVFLIVSIGYPDMVRRPGTRRDLASMVHYDEYDMSKYMQNREIADYLKSLRQKTRFRYEEIEPLKPR
jgi:5,6-dimethylbenzimidazole synthase